MLGKFDSLPEKLFLAHLFSIWMNEAQTAIKVRLGLGTQAGENPALRVLFYRLCRLLTLPIVPIFVFDGPDRPKVKRGINVKTSKPHWLSTPLKKFIEAFGFYWYTVSYYLSSISISSHPEFLQSPAEAEADLAELNKRNLIDAIFSEDNDNLVFGARCVIRMYIISVWTVHLSDDLICICRSNVKEAGDKVTVFKSDAIKTNPKVLLGREGLFLMAILCGGDYDTVSHHDPFFSLSYLNLNLRSDLMVVDGKQHVYSLRANSQHHYS
jgi:Holliday junction resolvase YEN1